jgi:hypothetical protein
MKSKNKRKLSVKFKLGRQLKKYKCESMKEEMRKFKLKKK